MVGAVECFDGVLPPLQAGSLGLAGGMTALFLDFATPMDPGTVSAWAVLSGRWRERSIGG